MMQLVVPCGCSFPCARFVKAMAALISFQYVSSLLGPFLLAALDSSRTGNNKTQKTIKLTVAHGERTIEETHTGQIKIYRSPVTLIGSIFQRVCEEKQTSDYFSFWLSFSISGPSSFITRNKSSLGNMIENGLYAFFFFFYKDVRKISLQRSRKKTRTGNQE